MLWKQDYQTIISNREDAPNLKGHSLVGGDFEFRDPQVLIMGWDFSGIASWEIWWKLLEDSFPANPHIALGFVTGMMERKHLSVLDQCIPVSRHRRTYLWKDPDMEWMKWSNFQEDRKVLVTLVRQDNTALTMQGLPTEDAWEHFETEFRKAFACNLAIDRS